MRSRIEQLSLKNKIFISFLGFILLVSVIIALFTRWLLISSLTDQLITRGTGIAQSTAEKSRGYILTRNKAELTSLAFDARVGNRKKIVLYLVIMDGSGEILAHTFTSKRSELSAAAHRPKNPLDIETTPFTADDSAYHVSVPVKEGIYTIGSVHVGLDKQHFQRLTAKLRFLFISFLSVVTIIFFLLSNYVARFIIKPISALIRYSDEISKGNYDIVPENKLQSAAERDEKDELKKLTTSFINMTAAIRSSRIKLKESEEKYRSLFTSGPNPIFVIDRHSLEIIDMNPKAVEMFGYGADELKGVHFSKLGSLGKENFSGDYPEGTASFVSSKVKFYTRSSRSIYMNLHASPARYKEKDALIVAAADITELLEKDTQLIQANKMTNLEKMSAGIAHELNQPLNAIKMGSEFLNLMTERKSATLKQQDLKQVAGEISAQVTRSAEIIQRLKTFSRKSDFAREIIDINNCIKSVNNIVGRQLKLQNIQLELFLDNTISPVLAHNNRMEQVIFNLVANARDAVIEKTETAGPEFSGVISISTWFDGKNVAVTIADNGTGIPPGERDKIFETFFTTKQMGEGMGLGLPIIRGIIRDYNGTISLETEEERGASFHILLPALSR
ncbi:MAG: ATP-binding protein [Desulfobacteraceae bacterium]